MLIVNGRIITYGAENQVLEGHAIRIEDSKIIEISAQSDLLARHPQEERLDAAGQWVMPGNICAHTHFYGAFARGMGIPGAAPKDFPEILDKLWWPLDKALDQATVRLSAEIMLIDAIRNGTTTLIDHHASPNAIEGSLDGIGAAVTQSGLRAVLCYEVTDRDGAAKSQAGIEENVRFISQQAGHDRIAATFGLHASLTLDEGTLAACREAADSDTGFHIHVAEHEADEFDSLARTGTRVVDRLAQHHILGPNTIVAHCVHIDAKETELLAESGSFVTHQPRSNMNNGVGAAPVESLLRSGIPVCLGTDGFPHSMWEEARFAYMLHKLAHRDPRRMSGDQVFAMATQNNAALANTFFPQHTLGVLQPGAQADIIFVDYHPHTPLSAGNLPWQIIFGFHERMVTMTMAAGTVLMKDRQLLTMDEAAVAARGREAAPALWQRYESFCETD
jgi:putative selenium metabolism protein SsnA